jgi:putative PIN family toxin of toxin-antitoxin system
VIRAVIDTNTLVSGFGWRGAPSEVVDAVLAARVSLILSPALHDELARVLRYPKLAAVFPEPESITGRVAAIAEPVEPTERIDVLADEADNRVLEAASEGEADVIITGDRALRELGVFRGTDILSAAEFLDRLADDEAADES